MGKQKTAEDLKIQYSTVGKNQEISADGVIYDKVSVYDCLHKLQDMRKAPGKQYGLVGLLMVILLTKLCGAYKPAEIADWGETRSTLRIGWQSAAWVEQKRRIESRVSLERIQCGTRQDNRPLA